VGSLSEREGWDKMERKGKWVRVKEREGTQGKG